MFPYYAVLQWTVLQLLALLWRTSMDSMRKWEVMVGIYSMVLL